MYNPKPIDTDSIILSPELKELVEVLAKNVHEVWAESRIRQGWKYEKERDDNNKLHPCLIPYEELSEIEKDYDRNTAMQTLRVIGKLGFKIVKDK